MSCPSSFVDQALNVCLLIGSVAVTILVVVFCVWMMRRLLDNWEGL